MPVGVESAMQGATHMPLSQVSAAPNWLDPPQSVSLWHGAVHTPTGPQYRPLVSAGVLLQVLEASQTPATQISEVLGKPPSTVQQE